MSTFNVITEIKNKINAKEIKIHIYKLAVRDMDNKDKENYSVSNKLSYLNNKITTAFKGQLIGSFEEIKEWGDFKYIDKEYRAVDLNNTTEIALLERFLLKDIILNVNKQKYKADKSNIQLIKPVFDDSNIRIYRYFKFDVNINNKGDIIIGFDSSHNFEYKDTLDIDIKNGTIKEGDTVKDFYNNCTYKFIGIAPFTISEPNEYMGISIKEYYINNKKDYIVNNLPDSTVAVLVKANNKKIFPYIPSRLKKHCRFENLPNDVLKKFGKQVKQTTTDKMNLIVEEVKEILPSSKFISVATKNMVAQELNYKVVEYKKPTLLFGNNKTGLFPSRELLNPNAGSFDKKSVNIKYFIDPNIAKNKDRCSIANNFCLKLEEKAKDMGVTLERQKVSGLVNFKEINTANEDAFTYDLKKAVSNFNETTVVILENDNLSKYYNTIKKTFGFQNNIATQCINMQTIELQLNLEKKIENAKNAEDKKKAKNAEDSLFLNILLGIFCKNGIQPWVLKEELHSDCFIGLDVSRENKVNKAGVVQVVGKDGRVLRTRVISSSQSGEKIKIETLKEIVFEAVSAYENAYNIKPRHITFHRDGLNNEEITELKKTIEGLGIKFDYIEVTKNINRRIANLTIDNNNKIWSSEIGQCFIKNNYAYLCTTQPFEKMGMAKPIRIRQVEGVLDMSKVVEDVYNLTFMHIGATNKTRLPITTYYADLSSTYGNRELMPVNVDSSFLHFV